MVGIGAAVAGAAEAGEPAAAVAVSEFEGVVEALAAQAQQGAQVAPQAAGAAPVVFVWGDGEEMVEGGAAGEDAFGALADDLDFGVGILTAGSDEGGSED